jgi:hypothetical protein
MTIVSLLPPTRGFIQMQGYVCMYWPWDCLRVAPCVDTLLMSMHVLPGRLLRPLGAGTQEGTCIRLSELGAALTTICNYLASYFIARRHLSAPCWILCPPHLAMGSTRNWSRVLAQIIHLALRFSISIEQLVWSSAGVCVVKCGGLCSSRFELLMGIRSSAKAPLLL